MSSIYLCIYLWRIILDDLKFSAATCGVLEEVKACFCGWDRELSVLSEDLSFFFFFLLKLISFVAWLIYFSLSVPQVLFNILTCCCTTLDTSGYYYNHMLYFASWHRGLMSNSLSVSCHKQHLHFYHPDCLAYGFPLQPHLKFHYCFFFGHIYYSAARRNLHLEVLPNTSRHHWFLAVQWANQAISLEKKNLTIKNSFSQPLIHGKGSRDYFTSSYVRIEPAVVLFKSSFLICHSDCRQRKHLSFSAIASYLV